MKYEVGMRWVWKDYDLEQALPDGHGILRGYIREVKPAHVDWYNITIEYDIAIL